MRRRDTSRPASGRRAIKRKLRKAGPRLSADERSAADGKSNKREKLLRRNTAKSARNQRSPIAGQEIDVVRLTRERDEALKQQAATAEVLRALSRSTYDLQSVLENLLEKAVRLCDAERGLIYKEDGDVYRVAASYGHSDEFLENVIKQNPIHRDRSSATGRAVVERRVVHIHDILADPEYHWAKRQHSHEGMHRTILAVPMLNGDTIIGVIAIRRTQVQPFTAKQIELLTTFAAQAVIAIENTRLLNELRQRTTDLGEALEQQTATSEVLRAISNLPLDAASTLGEIAQSVTRLLGVNDAEIMRCEGSMLRCVAKHGASNQWPLGTARSIARDWVTGRAIIDRAVVHVADLQAQEDEFPQGAAYARQYGHRTTLAVPLLREGSAIGAFLIRRMEVKPFTDKQIQLVTNFADQAVIAIENTRLLNELRQRTADLTESLEQQTATSEVLGVIGSSPGDLEPVFRSMLENATRICDAKWGTIHRWDGEALHLMATHNLPPAFAEARARSSLYHPHPGSLFGRIVASKAMVHTADSAAEPVYIEKLDPVYVAAVKLGGVRSVLGVPMLKDNDLIGAFALARQEVRPFTDKQIALVQNFAAQAVIAIENTRLLNELRESLGQQTATAEVLQVISSTPGDVQSVFDLMLAKATKLCEASYGTLWLREADAYCFAALHGDLPESYGQHLRDRTRFRVRPEMLFARVNETQQPVQVSDLRADQAYLSGDTLPVSAVDVAGVRTMMIVPMLKENGVVGAIAIYRQEVRLFTDKQIHLVENFAAQAVIAIENARLLNELRQSLQQQTATADVLKIISRSAFDLRSVLNTLVESAARLCETEMASVPRVTGGIFDYFASYGYSPDFHEFLRSNPILPGRSTASGRAVAEGKTIHIPDVLADPEYDYAEGQKVGGYRTLLAIPLLREGAAIGALVLGRSAPRPFTPQQIELAETFADQAVIAIENVRLFDEIQDKSRQLEVASQHKSQFLANMSHELRTPLNAILGYTELMTDGAYGEPSEKMMGVLKRLEANGRHLLGLINDVLDLSKIEAGQLVLELSDYCVQEIAQTVRSTLEQLAADKKLAFKLDLSPELPPGHGDGRRLTQVLINLVGNAIKFTDAGEVAIKAEAHNGSFHVSVRDTGPGISTADQTKLFQEFQQADNAITRKKGGTGLGLAISKRIIEMHGGKVWVESKVGQGSTFSFMLPVIVERQVEAT